MSSLKKLNKMHNPTRPNDWKRNAPLRLLWWDSCILDRPLIIGMKISFGFFLVSGYEMQYMHRNGRSLCRRDIVGCIFAKSHNCFPPTCVCVCVNCRHLFIFDAAKSCHGTIALWSFLYLHLFCYQSHSNGQLYLGQLDAQNEVRLVWCMAGRGGILAPSGFGQLFPHSQTVYSIVHQCHVFGMEYLFVDCGQSQSENGLGMIVIIIIYRSYGVYNTDNE